MSKHSQRPRPPARFVCTHCKDKRCGECTDIMRVVMDLDPICGCDLPNHSGDPTSQQVKDPFTETVHGPHGSISKDGEVYVEPEWKRAFRELFSGHDGD